MSYRQTLRVGGYDLSDDEAAELSRLQYGAREPTIFAGGLETETASTVGEDVRSLFKDVKHGLRDGDRSPDTGGDFSLGELASSDNVSLGELAFDDNISLGELAFDDNISLGELAFADDNVSPGDVPSNDGFSLGELASNADFSLGELSSD